MTKAGAEVLVDGELFIHIGRNKTGSTAIQQSLARSRPQLLSQGFIYPGQQSSHACLAMYLNKRLWSEQHEQDAAVLQAEIEDTKLKTVISCEGLQNINPKLLKDWLPHRKTTVIVYLREQAEYLWSFYAQAVKAKTLTANFEDFIRDINVDYRPFLAKWSTVFERVVVRPYDKSLLRNGDVVDDFLSVVGIDDSSITRPGADPNPSIGGALLEAKRRINGLGIPEGQLREAIYSRLLELARKNREYKVSASIPEDIVQAIRQRYAEANDEVSQKYLNGEPLFNHRSLTGRNYDEADINRALLAVAIKAKRSDRAIASQIIPLIERSGLPFVDRLRLRAHSWNAKLLHSEQHFGGEHV